MVRIAVLGSFNMDLVMRVERRPRAGETVQGAFAMHLGGKGFNQAVAARRLGAEVVIAGRVGNDEFGRRFLDALDLEGIDRRAVVVDSEVGTGVATIMVEPDGSNTIVQAPRANRRAGKSDIGAHAPHLRGADAALLNLETSNEGAIAFCDAVRCANVVLNPAPAPAGPVPDELFAAATVVVANEIETEAVLGIDPPERDRMAHVETSLWQFGIEAPFVVTLGASGASIVTIGREEHVRPFAVDPTDTTGAGDAFCAALAVRLAEGAELRDAVRFANAAGAVACTRAGAEPAMPYRQEVEELMAKGATK